jgi:hypothetical protein
MHTHTHTHTNHLYGRGRGAGVRQWNERTWGARGQRDRHGGQVHSKELARLSCRGQSAQRLAGLIVARRGRLALVLLVFLFARREQGRRHYTRRPRQPRTAPARTACGHILARCCAGIGGAGSHVGGQRHRGRRRLGQGVGHAEQERVLGVGERHGKVAQHNMVLGGSIRTEPQPVAADIAL